MLDRFPVAAGDFDGPVLVTGAGGCIGAWTLALLSRNRVPAVAFDLSADTRRPGLLIAEDELAAIPWRVGNIADTDAVIAAVADHGVRAIVHLAALQVPFCIADPVAGARANVVGTVNVLEAARRHGIRRVAYASSIAAHGLLGDGWLATLYGAYKLCDEMIARVYAQDWGVPSVGLRPGVVAGVGRDQGLTSKTTQAILAAAAGRPYEVPFTGPVSFLHAGEIAWTFIAAVSAERDGAPVFDVNGRATTVEDILSAIRALAPDARLTSRGAPLPFPADLPDAPVRAFLGAGAPVPVAEGVGETLRAFRALLEAGKLSPDAIA
ncbi:MAG TPA: SDR family oxidoreductase [Alphaproteobacteria bacterium]